MSATATNWNKGHRRAARFPISIGLAVAFLGDEGVPCVEVHLTRTDVLDNDGDPIDQPPAITLELDEAEARSMQTVLERTLRRIDERRAKK